MVGGFSDEIQVIERPRSYPGPEGYPRAGDIWRGKEVLLVVGTSFFAPQGTSKAENGFYLSLH